MPNFNNEQLKAITTRNKNILVSASAGSGKTTILVERLVRRIRDEHIGVNQILAMTFTEAAASEMKNRLKKELKEVYEKSEGETRAFLQNQLSAIDNAYISTIHGFCLKIIKEYYYTISLDKKRTDNIIDDATKQEYQNECLRRTNVKYMPSDAYVHLCMAIESRPESHEELNQYILQLYEMAQAKSDPIHYLETFKRKDKIHSFDQLDKDIKKYFFAYLELQAKTVLNYFNDLLFEFSDEINIDKISRWIKTTKDCILYANNHDYKSYIDTMTHLSKFDTDKKVKQTKKAGTIKSDARKLINERILKIGFPEDVGYETKNASSLCDMYNRALNDKNMLIDLAIEYTKQYNAMKEYYQCMDFNDLEHYAIQILQANDGLVATIYRNRFEEIMVDEFQDSNDTQDTLVHLICRENNVFRVGDIKQSIYGFRHATPEIMKNLINNKTEQDEIIYLSNNYRSSTNIVNFNNELFKVLMNIDGFNKAFDAGDYAIAGNAKIKDFKEKIHLHLIDKAAMQEANTNDKRGSDELKADYIAQTIIRLHEEKNYKFSDFCILVKANAKANPLRDAFDTYHIPYFIQMKSGFYVTPEILTITSFLQALDNPSNDIAMMAMLVSPLFGYSDEEMANIKLEKGKVSYYSYVQNDIPVFTDLLKMKNTQPLSIILKEIYKINSYYKLHTNVQEKSNLDKLYEMVCDMEKNEFVSVSSFLQVLKSAKDADGGEAIPLGKSDDVVQVMSIHQSKGLQFNVVFLYSTDKTSVISASHFISMDSNLGIGLPYVDTRYNIVYPSIEKIAINHKINQDQLEEDMRVLYVATTRAIQELHIVDCGKQESLSIPTQPDIYKKKGFTNWIYSVFNHDTDLFEVHYIKEPWNTVSLEEKELNTNFISLNYNKKASTISTSSPSENEFKDFTPREYNPFEEIAMQRGTDLHRMAEVLPSAIWTKDLLIETAKKENIHLNDKDYDLLLSLNKNEIWQESYKGIIKHEMPFMIKKDEQIMHGFMDYVSILDNKIILIDFKSDRNVDDVELIHRYHDQLKAYEEALNIIYHKQVETYIYSFELAKMIQI